MAYGYDSCLDSLSMMSIRSERPNRSEAVDSFLASQVVFLTNMLAASDEIIVVIVTVSGPEEGHRISRAILTCRLAACVTVIPQIESMYWWEGKIVQEREAIMVCKTTKAQFEPLEQKIKDLHSYQVPEIIAVPLVNGSSQYIEWIKGEVAN